VELSVLWKGPRRFSPVAFAYTVEILCQLQIQESGECEPEADVVLALELNNGSSGCKMRLVSSARLIGQPDRRSAEGVSRNVV
jgi:hypothetical protein